jgi:hypothetical protein
MKKPATIEEKKHIKQVVALGSIISGMPAEAHHPTFGRGKSQKTSNMLVIPLTPEEHRTGKYGYCIHAGRVAFEKRYGTELELLERVYARLKKPWPPKELTILLEKNTIRKSCLLS